MTALRTVEFQRRTSSGRMSAMSEVDGDLSEDESSSAGVELLSRLSDITTVRPVAGFVAVVTCLCWLLAGGVQFGLNGAAFLSRSVEKWWCVSAVDNRTLHFTSANCSTSWHADTCSSVIHTPHDEKSVATKFNLLCGEENRLLIAQILFSAGLFFGGILVGWWSDFAGRRKALLTGQVALIACGVWTVLSPNYGSFAASRFATGMSAHMVMLSGLVLAAETVPPQFRNLLTPLVTVAFIFGLCLLVLIGYLLRSNWILMDLATWCLILPLILLTWLTPESPHWLFSKQRLDELAKVVDRLERRPAWCASGHEVENYDRSALFDSHQDIGLKDVTAEAYPEIPRSDGRWAVWQLFGRRLRLKTLGLFWIWLTASAIYFGLVFGKNGLSGDLYLNFFLISAVELPASGIIIFTFRRFGRRANLIGSISVTLLVVVVFSGVLWAYPEEYTQQTLKLVFAMGLKFTVSIVMSTLLLYAPELFPTNLRTLGLAVVSSASSIGAALSPALIAGGLSQPGIVMTIKAVMLGLSLVIVPLLPETKDCVLPDHLNDL